ncbi:MAG: hypothetical protein J0M35_03090 [Candidatus Obscuribacter phosphatis]|uniref:Uncharacterized protein n=1 Tax=Candidatus Obscuribacter phosphatis TaxID=1906157 RepID=A0A8J7PDP1_9BACT|nr:hypothetical protein [Candidatus Obscuribacter phosphatis]
MPDNFNAHHKAMQLEEMAKELIANPDDKGAAFKKFSEEAHALINDPKKMKAVAVELEKIEDDLFTPLPNAEIERDKDGNVTDIRFKKSFWDRESDDLVRLHTNVAYSSLYGVRTPEERARDHESNIEIDPWRAFQVFQHGDAGYYLPMGGIGTD